MNLLIYAHAFAPRIGGAETYAMLLAKGLATGVAVSPDSHSTRSNVTVVTPTPRDAFDDATLPFRIVREPGVRELWRLIGTADIIQLVGPVLPMLILALLRRRRVVVEHHGYQAICPNGLLLYEPTKAACPGHFMARRYTDCLKCNAKTVGWRRSAMKLALTFPRRWLAREVAANISITRHVEARLNLRRPRVIYYGIADPYAMNNGTAATICATVRPNGCSSTTSAQSPMCFAFVGRLVSEKGLPLLIEAATQLRKDGSAFRVRFVGDGPERTRLESMTQARGLADCVSFTGFLTDDSLSAAMVDVAAVVMPSIWEETAGLAAMEQMMRGRLVIAADIGGMAEIVDGSGLKFRPGDSRALAACMQRVIEHPNLVQEVGRRARARALQLFTQRRMVSEYAALYESLTGESRRGT